jgi:hypothetical protein
MTDKMSAAEFQAYIKKQAKAKDSKYGGIPTQTADGEKFRSHVEAAFYNKHLLLQRVGDVVKIEREVRFELVVNGVFVCAYVLDFRITWKDGRVDHVDTKSQATMTALFRIKSQLMLACHGIEVQTVFWEDIKGVQK